MKILVTAEDIRKIHRDGRTSFDISPLSTIVTPEARDVASKLGIEFSESTNLEPTMAVNIEHSIQQAVVAKLPPGKHDPALLEQLIQKAMRELQQNEHAAYCERDVSDSGIVLVRGGSVKFGRFDGAPKNNIGLTDVVGSADNSAMGAGFMQWEKASFPWKLSYDEIDVVLEGELHITCDGKTSIGKPGDVFFIPKGSNIEFGTPGKVRFVYIAYPVDWAGGESSA